MAFFTQGVKYIKIARYDAFGNDNYQSLRELDNIRIRTVDKGIIDYPVATITEYPSSSLNGPYFLYQIVTTNVTSSTNNQILNYQVSASRAASISNISSPTSKIVNTYTENIDNLGYFDNSSGYITFQNTPNIPIIITSSVNFNINADALNAGSIPHLSLVDVTDLGVGLTSLNYASQVVPNIVLQVQTGSALSPVAVGTTGTITLTGSFTPTENRSYVLVLSNLNGLSIVPAPSWNGTNIDLKITQSITPQAGIGAQTILEPYITTPFINSDYDVLMNNAVINRPNSFYLDVDFTDSQILPINQQAILSSSASPAIIQDSYYSSDWWASSRYNGQQLRSAKLNQWSSTDIAPSKTPNVSNPKSYFVRFNWLAGTSPEWGNNFEGKTNVSIKYIIDENGNEVPPLFDENGINLGNIQQAFGNNNATLVLSNPDSFGVNLDSVNNTVPIFKAGQKIKPIIYTQTASYDSNGNVIGFGFTGSINFTQPDGQIISTGINNYSILAVGPGNTTSGNSTQNANFITNIGTGDDGGVIIPGPSILSSSLNNELIIPFRPINIGNSASFSTGSSPVQYWYQPTGSLGSLSSSGYVLYFDIYLGSQVLNGSIINYFLQKSTNGGSSWNNIAYKQIRYTGPPEDTLNSSLWTFSYTERNATTSSLYRLTLGSQAGSTSVPPGTIPVGRTLRVSAEFKVSQYPASSFNQTSTSCTLFWLTGSSPNILLANTGSTSAGGLNQFIGLQQQNINNSGFDPITIPFNLQPNDEIRFQGLENLSFAITNVTQSAAGQLQLNLDNNIPNGTNLNYFLIRRYIPDPGNIILDISKPAGQTSDGILIPEFLGEKANETKEKIVSLLRAQS
jgi:hypothetical protein